MRRVRGTATTVTISGAATRPLKHRSSTASRGWARRCTAPYTCTLYAIESDGTADTDIDHIVALAEAYESGLARDRFEEFGGDILNLTVAVPGVNRSQKSDNDAGEWRPERSQGWYAATVVAVKQKYGMSVDLVERDALEEMLAADPRRTVTCGG